MLHAFVIVIILKGLNEMILTTLTFERKKIKSNQININISMGDVLILWPIV
jgi:hypothetical protein